MDIQEVLPRDAIPSIDDPSFGSAYFGADDDEVIVVESDPPRAYPVRVLSYHEIVNDAFGELPESGTVDTPSAESASDREPIAVTWCPICASAVVYARTVDGRVLTFGTSGKLADDALVMYDRETGSEWKQPLGEAISGPLEGRELDVVPASMLSWAQFRAAYPTGVVLQPVRGDTDDPQRPSPRAAYDMTPYERYDSGAAFGLRAMRGEGPERTWTREDVGPKTPVLGIVHGGDAVGYPLPAVRAEGGVVSDSVGGLAVLVVGADDDIHAFEHPGHRFELRDGTLYGDGASWDLATGRSSDGRQLPRVPARRLYAFAWQDDHGERSFYGLN
ncbi:MAG: DUF3179 domain-containing protein [Halobacteriales archaeon]